MPSLNPYPGRDRRIARPSPLFIALSVTVLAGIAFATLCPIGLRPHFASANVERFGAYALLGFVIAMTFRRRVLMVAVTVIVLAVALEAGQLLIPGRDARVVDAAFKALGGLSGVAAGYAFFPLKRLTNRLMHPMFVKAAPAKP
jgi:hypothetical protein